MERPTTRARALAAGLIAIAAGLSAVPLAGGQTRAGQPPAVPAPIAWSAEKALSWSNYLGSPQMGSDAAAVTVYRLSYEEQCVGDDFTFRAVSYFEPAQSWVKPSAIMNSTSSHRLLAHEQGHFDLSEVQARRLRRALRALIQPCRMPAADREAVVTRRLGGDADAQARYDRETGYGVNDSQQTRWIVDIARELKALAEFADGKRGAPSPDQNRQPAMIVNTRCLIASGDSPFVRSVRPCV